MEFENEGMNNGYAPGNGSGGGGGGPGELSPSKRTVTSKAGKAVIFTVKIPVTNEAQKAYALSQGYAEKPNSLEEERTLRRSGRTIPSTLTYTKRVFVNVDVDMKVQAGGDIAAVFTFSQSQHDGDGNDIGELEGGMAGLGFSASAINAQEQVRSIVNQIEEMPESVVYAVQAEGDDGLNNLFDGMGLGSQPASRQRGGARRSQRKTKSKSKSKAKAKKSRKH
jgi:hypothetical protein